MRTALRLAEIDRLERVVRAHGLLHLASGQQVDSYLDSIRLLLSLVDRMGKALDWALTYTNARTAEESPAANNPLRGRALDRAIAALRAYQQAKREELGR